MARQIEEIIRQAKGGITLPLEYKLAGEIRQMELTIDGIEEAAGMAGCPDAVPEECGDISCLRCRFKYIVNAS
jgi:hypothetical protein